MFQGFIDIDEGGTLIFQLRTAAGAPVEPDSAPRFKIVGPSGLVGVGNVGAMSSLESGNVSAASNASPIVITYSDSPTPRVTLGQSVTIASVGGNTAANGTWIVSAVTSNTFTLSGSVGNGAYTSGGTWKTTGLYKASITGALLSGLTAGQTYTVIVTWLESSVRRTMQATFTAR